MTSRVTSYSRAIRSQSSAGAAAAAIGVAANGRAAAPSKVLRSISILSLRSNPDVTKIIRPPALAARLGPVAGFNPAAGGFEEVFRALGLPLELVPVPLHDHQRPSQIGLVVARELELTTRFELGREQVDRAIVDHPPFGVPRLGPGIGMEQVEEA